ncbi:MAG: hypothetical protein R2784_07410 [Saprospiraceae bacterium]
MTDWEMELMLSEEKKSGAFSREIARKTLVGKRLNLKALMEDPLWKELKDQIQCIQKAGR